MRWEAVERALGIKMRYATKSRSVASRAGDHRPNREGVDSEETR